MENRAAGGYTGKKRKVCSALKTLYKDAWVLNVYTRAFEKTDLLTEDSRILAVGNDLDQEAERICELAGTWIIPGLLDAHMHVESTMMTPAWLSEALLQHGTTGIVADPHEIANVLGTGGIQGMMDQAADADLDIWWTLPSCVPSSPMEAGARKLQAADLKPFWREPSVIGLGEVMNVPGVLCREPDLMEKIRDGLQAGKRINGHAPGVTGRNLDVYAATGITDDHECSSLEEGMDRIRRGMTVLIREGSAARNLEALMGLFQDPWCRRSLLCTDDRHPADLQAQGHIDHVIRKAISLGADPVTAICMATVQTADYYGLKNKGTLAPGKDADFVVLSDLDTFAIHSVYKNGKPVHPGETESHPAFPETARNTVHLDPAGPSRFALPGEGKQRLRAIQWPSGTLVTEEVICEADPRNLPEDLAKAAVLERHRGTGLAFTGLIQGSGLVRGAVASTVGHDAHNLLVMGKDDRDMALAANTLREIGGGLCTVLDGKVLAVVPLPVAGLMAEESLEDLAQRETELKASLRALGADPAGDFFMTLSFLSLPVIPHLKLTAHGLFDVDENRIVPLQADLSDA